MDVRELMLTEPAIVPLTAPLQDVARAIATSGSSCALVTAADQRLLGLITKGDIARLIAEAGEVADISARELMTPNAELATVAPETDLFSAIDLMISRDVNQLPVVADDHPIGLLTRTAILPNVVGRDLERPATFSWDRWARTALKSLHDGLIVVDKDLVIREFNDSAGRMTGLDPAERIGQKARVISTEASPLFDVLATGKPLYDIESSVQGGRIWLVSYLPIIEQGTVTGVVQTFTDVTKARQAEAQLRKTKDELDKAFALTLPNSRVEQKLKSTPEYRDEHDPESGLIRITGVIPDGSYQHVVNALKVAADLNDKGVMSIIGIDKDALVQAIIFHDIGKAQPELRVGEIVDPKVVFEPSSRHAQRSADIAQHYYGKNDQVVQIIRHHHRPEDDLPPTFPSHLLSMLRLFQVIDGLSAALTRRQASVEVDRVGSWIQISEHNPHPDYNQRWAINLMTGERRVIEQYQLPGGSQNAAVAVARS